MKRLFYLFLLVFISIFTLSSCNKNNSTESNNSTNTETTNEEDDSIYQVTKEEFQKANSFENENYKTVVDYTKIVNGIAEKSNYYYEVRDGYGRQKIDGEWGIIQKIDNFPIARAYNMVVINDYYEQFYYDENIKSYVADAVKLYDYTSHRIICKYENKRLIHAEVYVTYNDNDNQDNSIINYEYDVVEPFEDIPYVVTKEEFNCALDFTKITSYSYSAKHYKKWSDREEMDYEGIMIVERINDVLSVYFKNINNETTSTKTYDANTFNPLRMVNYSCDNFKYDSLTKNYKGHVNDAEMYFEGDVEFKFNNKRLVSFIIIQQKTKDVIQYAICEEITY